MEETLTMQWLLELRTAASILVAVDDCLAALEAKRITLEEKMIRRHMHLVAKTTAVIVQSVHETLLDNQPGSSERLAQWQAINVQIVSGMEELLKIIRYDPNFLEQYYEYGFLTKLNEDFRWVEKLQEVANQLAAESAKSHRTISEP
jgi:hypothetical protein